MMNLETRRNVYVGHRYVPKIMGEWSITNTYEGLSIVTYEGSSYTSKQHVPTGINIKNEDYWVLTGNYNAQVEYYRKETEKVSQGLIDLDEYSKNQSKLIQKNTDRINEITYLASDYGIKADYNSELKTGTDNSTAFKKMLSELPNFSTVKVPKGQMYFTQPIILDKDIRLISENYGGIEDGTVLLFDNCDGIHVKKNYIPFENISIRGINKATELTYQDVANGKIGNVGLLLQDGNDFESSGLRSYNSEISGFNTGVAIRKGSTGLWAGAYRDFYSLIINYNDVGLYVVDGGTHNKFYGGAITNNKIHGIYTKNNVFYSNIELIGTTIENNGMTGEPFNSESYKKYGIYSGNKSKVNIIGGYLEKMNLFGDGGNISLTSTYVHDSVKMFTRNSGSINEFNSLGAFSNKYKFKSSDEILNSFTLGNATATSKGNQFTAINIKSESVGKVVQATSDLFFSNGIKVKDITWLKFSSLFKVIKGRNTPSFNIKPVVTLTARDNSKDGTNQLLAYPSDIYTFEGSERIGYFFKPRTSSTYLNPEAEVYHVRMVINFFDDYTQTDFSTGLEVEMYDPTIEVFSNQDMTLNLNKKLFKETITPLNNWTGTLSVTKNYEGMVTLTGKLSGGTKTANTVIGKLPPGYTPKTDIQIVASGGVGAFVFNIAVNGDITTVANNFETSLGTTIEFNNSYYV